MPIQHTPGPWKFNPATLSGFNFIEFRDENDNRIFRVQFPGIDRERSIANAGVIGAAPELLAVLKKMYKFELIEYAGNFEYVDPSFYEARALLERLGQLPSDFL
jgi:hypothetical protein